MDQRKKNLDAESEKLKLQLGGMVPEVFHNKRIQVIRKPGGGPIYIVVNEKSKVKILDDDWIIIE